MHHVLCICLLWVVGGFASKGKITISIKEALDEEMKSFYATGPSASKVAKKVDSFASRPATSIKRALTKEMEACYAKQSSTGKDAERADSEAQPKDGQAAKVGGKFALEQIVDEPSKKLIARHRAFMATKASTFLMSRLASDRTFFQNSLIITELDNGAQCMSTLAT